MRVQNINNVDEFFKVIDACKGRVELITGEGDRLNLKSKFLQYVSLDGIFADKSISELEIIAHEPDDITRLVNFMMTK